MTNYLTPEGYKEIIKKLNDLKTVRRIEVARRIESAKELGDLSENAEYAEAKDEQAFIEGEILEIESLIQNATVIVNSNNKDVISVGSIVTVEKDGANERYTIVGSNESNPAEKKISNESPLGKALIGKRIGETVTLQLPKGSSQIRIVKIE